MTFQVISIDNYDFFLIIQVFFSNHSSVNTLLFAIKDNYTSVKFSLLFHYYCNIM